MHILLDGKKFKVPDIPIKVKEYKRVISSQKETGIIQSRAAFTRSLRTWTLSWTGNNALPKDDFESPTGLKGFDTLRTLRLDKAGGSFNFYHVFEEVTYTVCFIESEFSYEMVIPDYYTVTLSLQEK